MRQVLRDRYICICVDSERYLDSLESCTREIAREL